MWMGFIAIGRLFGTAIGEPVYDTPAGRVISIKRHIRG